MAKKKHKSKYERQHTWWNTNRETMMKYREVSRVGRKRSKPLVKVNYTRVMNAAIIREKLLDFFLVRTRAFDVRETR